MAGRRYFELAATLKSHYLVSVQETIPIGDKSMDDSLSNFVSEKLPCTPNIREKESV